jgi:hypothetical protein
VESKVVYAIQQHICDLLIISSVLFKAYSPLHISSPLHTKYVCVFSGGFNVCLNLPAFHTTHHFRCRLSVVRGVLGTLYGGRTQHFLEPQALVFVIPPITSVVGKTN